MTCIKRNKLLDVLNLRAYEYITDAKHFRFNYVNIKFKYKGILFECYLSANYTDIEVSFNGKSYENISQYLSDNCIKWEQVPCRDMGIINFLN